MSVPPAVSVRVCRVGAASLRAMAAMLILGVALPAIAAPVLFPTPLHITREVTDPLSATTTVIDEYCHGNRIVSISGTRTAIVDHEKGLVTVIDTGSGTWSEARFEEIARVQAAGRRPATTASSEWRSEERSARVVASRPGEVVEISRAEAQGRHVIEVTLDRQLTLGRAALEAILGTGYPRQPDSAADALIGAARSRERRVIATSSGAAPAEAAYHLPLEQTVRFELAGEVVETRNVVTRIGTELPPPDRLSVPPGSTRVELPLIAASRLLEELDQPSRQVP